jgi:hypothetical protein
MHNIYIYSNCHPIGYEVEKDVNSSFVHFSVLSEKPLHKNGFAQIVPTVVGGFARLHHIVSDPTSLFKIRSEKEDIDRSVVFESQRYAIDPCNLNKNNIFLSVTFFLTLRLDG